MLRRAEARKERRKKIMIGIVLVFFMGTSMLGVIIGSRGNETWKYNGFKFERYENAYVTKINKEKMGFNFLPQTVENIPITGDINSKLLAPQIFMSFDPNASGNNLLFIDTVRSNLQLTLNTYIIGGITKKSDFYVLPIITCDNATPQIPVFVFNISNETSIIENNNCVILNGREQEFFKLRDLMIYRYFGVIDD